MQCDTTYTNRNYCKQAPGAHTVQGGLEKRKKLQPGTQKAEPPPSPAPGYTMLLERLCPKIQLTEEGSGRSLSASLCPPPPSMVQYGMGGACVPLHPPQTHNAPALPAIGQELQASTGAV